MSKYSVFVFNKHTAAHAWIASIHLPIFALWKPKVYNLNTDGFERGWFLIVLCLRVGKFGFGMRVAHDIGIAIYLRPWFVASYTRARYRREDLMA